MEGEQSASASRGSPDTIELAGVVLVLVLLGGGAILSLFADGLSGSRFATDLLVRLEAKHEAPEPGDLIQVSGALADSVPFGDREVGAAFSLSAPVGRLLDRFDGARWVAASPAWLPEPRLELGGWTIAPDLLLGLPDSAWVALRPRTIFAQPWSYDQNGWFYRQEVTKAKPARAGNERVRYLQIRTDRPYTLLAQVGDGARVVGSFASHLPAGEPSRYAMLREGNHDIAAELRSDRRQAVTRAGTAAIILGGAIVLLLSFVSHLVEGAWRYRDNLLPGLAAAVPLLAFLLLPYSWQSAVPGEWVSATAIMLAVIFAARRAMRWGQIASNPWSGAPSGDEVPHRRD